MPDTPQSLTEALYSKNLELLYERKRMEQLLYSVSEAVLAVDTNFRISLYNHAAELLTNKSSNEVLGKDIEEVLDIFDKDGNHINIKDFCFNKEKYAISNVILYAGEKKHNANFNSITVVNADTPAECLITLTDITKEKQLEQAKDDFISVASHELRTPMTIIKSYLWMLTAQKGGPLNTKQYEYLVKATNATQRMIDLINDTLSISRLEQGRVEFSIKKFDLTEAIYEFTTELSIKAQERKIYLKIAVNKQFTVYADRDKVGEVVTNLIGNSIKFTREGGVEIKAEDTGDFIKVSIVDTGAGMNITDQKSLFLKFGRLDNSYQTVAESGGTGLGLYIVKLYIEGMGGEVGAYSEGVKKGSTFWFTLPKNKPADKDDPTTIA